MIKKIRALIVDDDDLIRSLLGGYLKMLGIDVCGSASNGEQAIALNEKESPDVILMDISMQGMDGIEASRIINENKPTPIVILSAYDSEDMVSRATKAGVGAYLVKPPSIREIDRAVTIAIARFKDMQKLRETNKELKKALEEISTLRGYLPICSVCNKVRSDEGYWERVEEYIKKHTDLQITHGICPDCMENMYPEYYDENDHKGKK